MKKLPGIFVGVIWTYLSFFFPRDANAVTIASQNQAFESQLNVWQALQELGTNLSGTVQNFTFRVNTSKSNLDQFGYTAANTRIYDKSDNSYITGCVSSSTNPNDPLRGLTFNVTNVPAGYEDVTIDFSCRNYNFISSHRYLIYLSNANAPNMATGRIQFASATYSGSSNDYFIGGGLRYAIDNGYCSAGSYLWNSQSSNSGCNVFATSKDDLYFVLTNTSAPPPPPRVPVIFIPGIGGSELKASQDIIWSKDNGHGGIYSHAYTANEKIWVNPDEAAKLGDDDYFDVLKLKADGQTSEADLSLTGNLTSFGYGEIDSFFTGMEYVKNTNFFVFPYDWRKDIKENKDNLDSLIEQAKTASGQSKVNIIVHSMGGLIARYYISDSTKASKINKLIELGVPHLGAVDGLKAIIYGKPAGRQILGDFYLGIPASEIKDIFQNLPSAFQLLPSNQYFNSNSDSLSPFRDDRDIDNNKVTGTLTYEQTKNLLSNLNYNMAVYGIGEQLHNSLDPIFNQTNGTKVYEIVGTAQPTLGQIHETWWITWPINLIPKTDEIYINGDGTVPLYSASLKNDSLDISGAYKIYYVEQKHSDLVSSAGTAMQTVKTILNDDNSLSIEVKDQKISLEGYQLTLDDGELDLYDDQNRHCGLNDKGDIEENIPEVSCTTSGNTKHAFVKKKSAKVKVRTTRKKKTVNSKSTTLKKRTYKQDKIFKTTLYKDILLTETAKVEFTLDPAVDTPSTLNFYPDDTKSDSTTIIPTSEVTSDTSLDQSSPKTKIDISGTKDSLGIYSSSVTITLTGSDSQSGILKIEYSLDNGQTVQTYTEPFTISVSGKTTVQFKSIDKLGNEEIPQTLTIEIAPTPTPTPAPASSTSGSSSISSSSSSSSDTGNSVSAISTTSVIANKTKQSSNSITSPPAILGISFENPNHISNEINVSNLLDQQKNSTAKTEPLSIKQILEGLLIISAGIGSLAILGLGLTFIPFQAVSTAKTSLSIKSLTFNGKPSPVKPFPK